MQGIEQRADATTQAVCAGLDAGLDSGLLLQVWKARGLPGQYLESVPFFSQLCQEPSSGLACSTEGLAGGRAPGTYSSPARAAGPPCTQTRALLRPTWWQSWSHTLVTATDNCPEVLAERQPELGFRLSMGFDHSQVLIVKHLNGLAVLKVKDDIMRHRVLIFHLSTVACKRFRKASGVWGHMCVYLLIFIFNKH